MNKQEKTEKKKDRNDGAYPNVELSFGPGGLTKSPRNKFLYVEFDYSMT